MPTEISWPGFSISPSVNSSSASPRSRRPRSATNFASGRSRAGGLRSPRSCATGRIRRRTGPRRCPATETTYSPESRSTITWATVANPSSHCWRMRNRLVAGRKSSCGTEPSRPPKAPDRSSARVPASTPLPDTSTSATSNMLPSSERVATRKSPEKDAPPAERSTTSACQPSGSVGISPCAVSRSRGRPASVATGPLHAQPAPGPGQQVHDARRRQDDHENRTGRHPRRARAISSTTAAATTMSSRSRLRTESRKPPTRTTIARAESGNQVRFTRNRAPRPAAHRLRATKVNPSEYSTCRLTQGPGPPPRRLPRPRRLERVADMATTVAR